MATRVISSAGVVAIGLLAIIAGGALFALLMIVVGTLGYREYLAMTGAPPAPRHDRIVGATVVAALAVAGWIGWQGAEIAALVFGGAALPLVLRLAAPPSREALGTWAFSAAGVVYLGVPAWSATSLRGLQGGFPSGPPRGFEVPGLGLALRPDAPNGLAWTLLVVVAIWVSDSAAYLGGRAWGRRKLCPHVSPNKTIEGALFGLGGAALVGAFVAPALGLQLPAPAAVAFGVAVGLAGELGDLGESLFKRAAGIKDSGALIPGHGGILDRVDGLLFALPVGWVLASLAERLAP